MTAELFDAYCRSEISNLLSTHGRMTIDELDARLPKIKKITLYKKMNNYADRGLVLKLPATCNGYHGHAFILAGVPEHGQVLLHV